MFGYFHRLFASMFESRSVAALSRSGLSVHTRANSFHNMLLLLFGLSSNQPPARKQCGEKRESKSCIYEKEKTNRKWQDSWKWAASGEEHFWLTNDETKSGISDHRTLLNAQPLSLRELRTTKGPLCMNAALRLSRQRRAQAKLMEPNMRSRLRNNRERWFFQTANALAKKAGPHSDSE